MFVAEMDFPLAPEIKAALQEAIELGDTGYVNPHDTRAAAAFANSPRMRGMNHSSAPHGGDHRCQCRHRGIAAPTYPGRRGCGHHAGPVYPPFFDLVREAEGVVVQVPLLDDGMGYTLDLGGIDEALSAGARGVLLCNPHNPVGLVHSCEQLAELSTNGGPARRIRDQRRNPRAAHAQRSHVHPVPEVSDQARDHGIAAESGSKAFNWRT